MPIPQECRLCGAKPESFEIVGELVYGGTEEQKFYACPKCGVAFLYPVPSVEDEARFYAQEFEKYMENRADQTRGWTGPEEHIAANQDAVARRMPFLEPELSGASTRLLELGCSSGFMLLPLKDQGVEVTGVEPSGIFAGSLREKGVPVYDSLEDYVEKSENSGGLDIITHFFLLEHVRDPLAFLRTSLELLKPTGKIFFEVPSRSDPLITIYDAPAFQNFYWSVAHHWYFNRMSLDYLLGQLPCAYELIPEQRYDLSNHIWWILNGKPGGMRKFSNKFTPELDEAYKESMRQTGHCDTFFVWLRR